MLSRYPIALAKSLELLLPERAALEPVLFGYRAARWGVRWHELPRDTRIVSGGAAMKLNQLRDVVAIADILIKIKNCLGPEETEVTAGNFVFIKWWMLFQALDMAAMASALKVANAGRSWTLIPMLLLQRFLYWPLIYWTAALSLIGALKGRSFGWRKLARTGSVSMEPALLEVREIGNGLTR